MYVFIYDKTYYSRCFHNNTTLQIKILGFTTFGSFVTYYSSAKKSNIVVYTLPSCISSFLSHFQLISLRTQPPQVPVPSPSTFLTPSHTLFPGWKLVQADPKLKACLQVTIHSYRHPESLVLSLISNFLSEM